MLEYDEMELSQEDFQRFKEWQNINKSTEQIKKKVVDADPSMLWNVVKTLGVALAPALLGVIQRSALKAVTEVEKEKPPGIQSENFIHASGTTGSGQWDPLSQPKF